MKRNINPREALAWIVLACAAFLFSITIAFAQNSNSQKGKMTIKISKTDGDKTTKIDTMINIHDDVALEKILDSLGVDHPMNFDFDFPDAQKGNHVVIRHFKMNKERKDDDAGQADSKDLKKKDISIHIFSDKDGEDSGTFNFDFEMPEIPATAFGDYTDFSDSHCKVKMHQYFLKDGSGDADDDRIEIIGDKDESAPVFEKEIKGENGEKIFIYKRSIPEKEKSKDDAEEKEDEVNLYPNPNDGKFSLKFHVDQPCDLSVKVYNSQGKEVYAEKMKDFSGDYDNQLNLSGKAKGNYILKISEGKKTISEKFVIE